jgi:hypothetical protein
MSDEPRGPVEPLVRRLVGTPESVLWNLRQLLASLQLLDTHIMQLLAAGL